MMTEITGHRRHIEELLAPTRALGGLALANTEHVVHLQLENLRQCATAMFASWRDALAVKDWHGMSAYLARQGETAHEVAQNMVDASQLMFELTRYYADEMRKVVDHGLAGVTRRAA